MLKLEAEMIGRWLDGRSSPRRLSRFNDGRSGTLGEPFSYSHTVIMQGAKATAIILHMSEASRRDYARRILYQSFFKLIQVEGE